jgi:pseudaminic acid cytidylyltransferase
MVLAIIPARGGSKRIPGKNTRSILGNPAIVNTINLLRKSQIFEEVFVTTDDNKIADLCVDAGAKVPFIREPNLSDDFTTTKDVIVDFIKRQENLPPDEIIICVYPVTPFLKIEWIRKSIEILETGKNTFVFAAQELNALPERSFRVGTEGIKIFGKNFVDTRTQDIAKSYFDCGQFYTAYKRSWIQESSIISDSAGVIVIPKYGTLDIDSPEDWRFMEELLRLRDTTDLESR